MNWDAPMEIVQVPLKGYAFLTGGGSIEELAHTLNMGIVRHVPGPMAVPRLRGAAKAFSFHWSNGQRAWDVIMARDFPASLDGAEFILFVGAKALSPRGKPWSLPEMEYVAKKLNPHPGFAWSMEGGQRQAKKAPDFRWMPLWATWAEAYIENLIYSIRMIDDDWLDNPASFFDSLLYMVEHPEPALSPKANPKTSLNEPVGGRVGVAYMDIARTIGRVKAEVRVMKSLGQVPGSAETGAWKRDLEKALGLLRILKREIPAFLKEQAVARVAAIWLQGTPE